MITYYVKRNDLLPAARRTCELNGAAVDLTGYTSVEFHMWIDGSSTMKVNAAGSFIDRANGVVEYQWTGTDTNTAGEYYCEWEIIDALGRPITFPNAPADTAESQPPHDRVLISEDGA